MAYYLPSTDGQVEQTETSLPIHHAAFNCLYFEEELLPQSDSIYGKRRELLFMWQVESRNQKILFHFGSFVGLNSKIETSDDSDPRPLVESVQRSLKPFTSAK